MKRSTTLAKGTRHFSRRISLNITLEMFQNINTMNNRMQRSQIISEYCCGYLWKNSYIR